MASPWSEVKDREAWHAAVHGVSKSRTWLSDWTTTIWLLFKVWHICSVVNYVNCFLHVFSCLLESLWILFFLIFKIKTVNIFLLNSGLLWCHVWLTMQETQRCRFDFWVEKIPWSRKWQPTPDTLYSYLLSITCTAKFSSTLFQFCLWHFLIWFMGLFAFREFELLGSQMNQSFLLMVSVFHVTIRKDIFSF